MLAGKKRLTDEQIKSVIDLYSNTDMELKDIALRLAMSVSGILRIIKVKGVAHRKVQHKTHNKNIDKDAVVSKYKKNVSLDEIMKSENVSWSGLFSILKESGVAFLGKECGDSMSPDKPNEKRCSKCGEWKRHLLFTKSNRYVGGIHHKCKTCSSKRYLELKSENPKPQLLARLRNRAKKKGIEFSLTADDLQIPELCPVLGMPIKFNLGRTCDDSISVDRVDNSKGYTSDNIIITSRRANCLKNEATLDELERIYLFYKNLEFQKTLKSGV
jgi:predicted DNA-binding protein YlxM (UPF0122 family)